MEYAEAVRVAFESVRMGRDFEEATDLLYPKHGGLPSGLPKPTVTDVQAIFRATGDTLRENGRISEGFLELPEGLGEEAAALRLERQGLYTQLEELGQFAFTFPRTVEEATLGQMFVTLAETVTGRSALAGGPSPTQIVGHWNRTETDDAAILATIDAALSRVGRLYDPADYDSPSTREELFTKPVRPHREIPNPRIQEHT